MTHRTTSISLATLLLLVGCGEARNQLRVPDPAPAAAVYHGGRIYTGEPDEPWAQAIVTRGDRIAFVGADEEARARAAGATAYDLGGRVVLPGLIDAHTHPGLVAILSYDDVEEGGTPMPSKPKAAILEWLDDHIDRHWWRLSVTAGEWDVEHFLPEGPNKADLDEVSSWRPIIVFDNSAHSTWVNSAFLDHFGIDASTPDLSPVSSFVRDEHGEPTGWVKEFSLLPYIGDSLIPSKKELRQRLLEFVDFLARHGVTTLWDAGNLAFHDEVYEVVSELESDGLLPVRYEGSYHVYSEAQLDVAVETVLDLRRRFGGEKLRFDTVKIHYDGVFPVMTAALSEPYATDPDNRGAVIFERARLTEFLVELDGHAIDLHLHCVGDRATRFTLDAVEQARRRLGRPLEIAVTVSHLEYVQPMDIPRFQELGVHANFTPHWLGGDDYGEAGAHNLGEERTSQSMVAGDFQRSGANVTLSSDVVSTGETHRANPFVGLEMSVTRREYGSDEGSPVMPPADAVLTLEEALQAYTLNGARQLRREDEIGSLREGKLADFVVLDRNPFDLAPNRVHQTRPVLTVVGGQAVFGALVAAE